MQPDTREALLRRQRQWEAFHRWEAAEPVKPLSIDARIEWYSSAWRIFLTLDSSNDFVRFAERLEHIHLVRQRLRFLTPPAHNG